MVGNLLQRRTDESKLDYIKRIVYGKLVDKTIDEDYTELSELIFGEGKQFNSSEVRKRFYGIKAVLEVIDEEGLNDISGDELLKEIESKTIELEKVKIRMQDQKREYKNLIRPQARFERILEVMRECVDSKNELYPFEYNPRGSIERISEKEAVLIISDWHISAAFNHYFGKYNMEIAKSRIQTLLNKTIEYCKDNKIGTLHLELLGDNISGGIHWSSKVNSEEDCVSQTMTLCELLSGFIGELCNNINDVKVYSVVGNHSRVNMNKKDNQNGENLERLVPFYLKARLKDIPNVEIVEKANIDDGIIMFDVLNTKIVGVHGDLDRPTQVVDNMIKMLRVFPNEIHMGHLHHHYEKEEYEIEVVINGSLQGTDDYAKDIRKSGRAMQKLMIYDREGKVCTYKIKL